MDRRDDLEDLLGKRVGVLMLGNTQNFSMHIIGPLRKAAVTRPEQGYVVDWKTTLCDGLVSSIDSHCAELSIATVVFLPRHVASIARYKTVSSTIPGLAAWINLRLGSIKTDFMDGDRDVRTD